MIHYRTRPFSGLLLALVWVSIISAQILPPARIDTISVSGTVTENTGMLPVWKPLAGARVILFNENPWIMEPQAPIPVFFPLDTAYADSNGDYQFRNVAVSGNVLLTASHRGYYDSTASLTLTGTAKNGYTVNFQLSKIPAKELCVVRGRVLERGSGGVSRDIPVAGVEVTVTPNLEILFPLAEGYLYESYSAFTDAKGEYEILAAVTAETSFTLSINDARYSYYSEVITLLAGDTARLADLYLLPNAVSVWPPLVISAAGLWEAAVYPQPARTDFTVKISPELAGLPGLTATLYDLQGRLVWSRAVAGASCAVPAQAPGTYWLDITTRTGQIHRQAIHCIK